MCLGAVLLAAALSLFARNDRLSRQAEQAARELLPQLLERIPDAEDVPAPQVLPGTPVELIDPEQIPMTEVTVGGYSYIGTLSIPDLGLELPIQSQWTYRRLQISPCRYHGAVLSQDLVLLAHNYPNHFGKLSQLSPGDAVLFTDMDGNRIRYQVITIEVLEPTAVAEMTAGDYDLTLFTCTYGGQSRITVRCDLLMGA